MLQDPELNKILKEMWRIDHNLMNPDPNIPPLTNKEIKFYRENLDKIKLYYAKNAHYWLSK